MYRTLICKFSGTATGSLIHLVVGEGEPMAAALWSPVEPSNFDKASLARSMRLAWSSERGKPADFLASGTRASGEVVVFS